MDNLLTVRTYTKSCSHQNFIIQSVLKEWDIDEKTVAESLVKTEKDAKDFGEFEIDTESLWKIRGF